MVPSYPTLPAPAPARVRRRGRPFARRASAPARAWTRGYRELGLRTNEGEEAGRTARAGDTQPECRQSMRYALHTCRTGRVGEGGYRDTVSCRHTRHCTALCSFSSSARFSVCVVALSPVPRMRYAEEGAIKAPLLGFSPACRGLFLGCPLPFLSSCCLL
eukprot:scaffold3610_cov129-Isochrysis_galbana.AAC.4